MQTLRRLLRHKMALGGGVVLFSFVVLAVFAPWIAPRDPLDSDLGRRLQPGFWSEKGPPGFPLGTDHLGRDILSRVIYGTRISLASGLGPVVITLVVGFVFGSLVLVSPVLDNVAMRLMDILFAFPAFLLAMAVVAVMGAGLFNAVLAIAIVDTPRMARVIRGQMLALKDLEYMEAGRALGASWWRMLFRHALPNAIPAMIVYSSLMAGRAILTVAGLSYLGMGARPPAPEWGSMLTEARDLMLVGAWWGVTLPGLAILLTVLAFNMLGDALRDTLDPRLR